MKLYGLDENKTVMIDYFEKGEHPYMVLSLNTSGLLQLNFDWPKSLKSKGVFFIKKNPRDAIAKDTPAQTIKNLFFYGDIGMSPVDHFAGFVDDVSLITVCSNIFLFFIVGLR